MHLRVRACLTLAGLLAAPALPALAAVYADGTDLDAAVARAQPYIACNGGPAVTVETYKSDGTLIDFASGSLLTSPDGKNRTVMTAAHLWTHALAADPNAHAIVLTGTNRSMDRGEEFLVAQVLLAPGADGSLDAIDLAAMRLPAYVPNTGQFVIGTAGLGDQVTTTGVGDRLTQSQLRDGIYLRDGDFARFDGRVSFTATWGSEYYLNRAVFSVGQYPFGGVGAAGDSGSGTFLTSSFEFDAEGRITYGEYVGTAVGYGGDRTSGVSSSLYTDAHNPEAYEFIQSAIAVPEPASLGLLAMSAAAVLLRRRAV